VVKEGRLHANSANNLLDTVLQSEEFLANFPLVDEVTTLPVYLSDFSLVPPGYNDLGPGNRILYS